MNDSNTIPKLESFFTPENPLLTDEEAELVSTISGLVVMHDRLREAREVVKHALGENKALREARHTLVLGEAGCGKTTLLDSIRNELPVVDQTFQLGIQRHQPLLEISLPGSITTRSLAAHMLGALGDTRSHIGTCFDLTERLKRYIRECEVQLIWLDEFQHLLALGKGTKRGASARLSEACNWIKGIINDTKVSFVLMGTPETDEIVKHDAQIERRFTHLAKLEAFPPPSESKELVEFVDELLLNAVQLPWFDSADFFFERPTDAMRLWVCSEGVPSRIKDLVIRACLIAKRRDSRLISMLEFTTAFGQTRQKRVDFEAARVRRAQRQSLLQALQQHPINPFGANDEIINTLVRKMWS
jgi:energy-coupling factor transporter ATP-binding protein EcfA2